MTESQREFLRRHHVAVGITGMLLAGVTMALLVPRSLVHWAWGAVFILFGVYYAWARTTVPKASTVTAPQSIRDHFKRTRGLLVRIGVPLAMAWIVCVQTYPSSLTKSQREGVEVGGGVILLILVTVYFRDGFKCPRCGSNFKMERRAKLGRWSMDTRGAEEIWDACPHCGVRWDEPWAR